MPRKLLLACGVLSSLLYLGIDALAALRFGDYHSYTAQAISELGAIGAPTRELVEPLFIAFSVLLLAFAIGCGLRPTPRVASAWSEPCSPGLPP